jgi:hypothetical protein
MVSVPRRHRLEDGLTGDPERESDDLLRSHGQVLIHVLRRALPEDSLHPCSGLVHVAVLNRGKLLVRDGGTPEGDDHLPVLEPLGVERESGLETLVQLTPVCAAAPNRRVVRSAAARRVARRRSLLSVKYVLTMAVLVPASLATAERERWDALPSNEPSGQGGDPWALLLVVDLDRHDSSMPD